MRRLKLFLDAKAANTPPRGISKASRVIFSVLTLLLLSIGQVWGADESVDFSAQGYTNQQAIASYSGTNFSIAFDKGTNNNAPKYYTSGTAIRVYGSNTMTISSSTKTIAKIEITFGSSDGTNEITTNVGDYSNGKWTGSESSVTFTVGGTSGNRRLSAVAVTYATGGGNGGGSAPATQTWDLTQASYDTPTSTASVTWSGTNVSMVLTKGTGTNANNYLGGDANNRTSSRFYGNNGLTITPANGQSISSVEFTATSTNYATAFGNSTWTNATAAVDGTKVTITPTNGASAISATIGGTCGFSSVTVNFAAPSTSTKNPAGLAYSTNNYKVKKGTSFTSPTVTNPNGLTVSYASDNASAVEVNATSGAITIHTVGKAVITASSEATDQYEAGSASYTVYVFDHEGTTADPYSVADARRAIDWNYGTANVYAAGKVSAIVTAYSSQHGNITYNFSTDGTTNADQLQAYRGKGKNGANFTSENDVLVDDEVVVYGSLTKYGSTYEFAADNQLYSRKTKAALSWNGVTANAFAAELNGQNTFPTLVNTNNVDVIYSSSETGVATIIPSTGAISLEGIGSTTITATFEGNENYLANSVSYTLTVASSVTKADISFEENGGSSVQDLTNQTALPSSLPTTTKAGKNFGGWYTTSTFDENTEAVPGATVTSSDPITLYAKWEDPYTVTKALEIINAMPNDNDQTANSVYVSGIVCTAPTANPSSGKLTFYISADGTETGRLQAYNCKGLNEANFTAKSDIQVLDIVTIYGPLKKYVKTGTTDVVPEFNTGFLYSFKRLDDAELAWSTDEFDAYMGQSNTFPTLTNDHNVEVTYSSSETDYATIDPSTGVITLVASGNTTITATFEGDDYYKAAEVSYTLKVRTPIVHGKITYEENGGSTVDDVDDATELPDPLPTTTKALHTFVGWFTDAEFNTPAVAGASLTGDVTLFAKWEEIPSWAYTYTSNLADVNNGGSIVKFYGEDTEYKAIKAGTGKAAGSTTITVPAQASKLHFHAYGWNGESVTLSITAPAGVTVSPASQVISANTGISGSTSTYTLAEGSTPETDAYFAVNLSGNNDEIELTISATSGNRFVLFGVNQEGGVLPVLDHIVVTGTATALEYEVGDVFNPAGLGANAIYTLGGVEQEPVAIDADDIEWSFEPATIAANTTAVTVTATYEGKSDDKEVTGLTVSVPEPEIEVSATSLAFGKVAKGATVADKELTVTLKSVENATLAISGDGASAFSLDEYALTATGVVTVSASSANVGTFEATLTISDDANAAEAQEVELSITIEAADDLSGKWTLVTDDAILQAGMKVIIASIAEGSTITTLGKQAGANADGNNRVGVTGGSVSGTVLTPAAGTKVFTLVDAGEGKLAFQGTNGKYLYAASSSSNHLKEQATNDANGKWTISIDDDAKATITAQGSNSRSLMRFNPNNGNPIFACYAPNTNTGTEVSLYTLDGYSRNVTEGRMGTVCVDHNVPAGNILGAEVYQLLFWKYGTSYADCQMVDFEQVDEMEAGKPYMIIPTANKMRLIYGETSVNAPVAYHGFTGTFEAIAASATNVLVGKYGIVNNSIQKLGENCSSQANRAYIDLSQTPSEAEYEASQTSNSAPKKRVSLSHKGTQVTTGLDAINLDTENVQKVMIEGQIYIIRGGHVFTTSGSLVK